MANKIQFRRGNAADRPTLDVAEPGLDLDTNDLWLGTPGGNVKIYPPAALGSIGLSGSPLAGQIAVFDSPTDATGYADFTWNPATTTLGVDGYLSLAHQTASPVGAIGSGHLFVKASDAHLYFMDELGNETDLLAFGGGRLLVEPDPLTVSATDDYTIFARQTLNDPTAEAGTQTMTLIKGDISVVSQTGWDAVNLMDLQVNGVSKFLVSNAGALTLSSSILSGGDLFAGSGVARYIGWQSKSSMQSPVDGNITLSDATVSDFGMLQFGGSTSAFPAIKRAGSALSVVLADDSGDADLYVGAVFAGQFNGNVTLDVGQTLTFNTSPPSSLYADTTTSVALTIRGSANIIYGSGYNQFFVPCRFRDDVMLRYGNHDDYTHVYNSTSQAFELWSSNVDGGGSDGIVMSIDDGTDDVNFSGSLNLKIGEKLILDADGTGNDYIYANADGSVIIYANGAFITQWQAAYTRQYKPVQFDTNAHIVTNTKLQVGGLNYSTPYYWQTYNSTGTAFELWSTNVDGSGSDGKILWVNDGTDDVNFSGNLILAGAGGAQLLSDNGKVTIGGTGGTNNENLVFDFETTANKVLLTSTTGVNQINTSIYWGGPIITTVQSSFGSLLVVGFLRMYDGHQIRFGTGDDYWQTYNSTGTAFELWSTNVDGSGSDGKILWVNDGTDDVNFSGNLILAGAGGAQLLSDNGQVTIGGTGGTNNENLVFDFETTGQRAILTSDTGVAQITTTLYWGGPVNTTIQSSFGSLLVGGFLRMYDGHQIRFGTGDDQSLVYTDGTGVTWNDGTNTVLTIPDDSNQVVMSGGSILSNTGVITLGGTGGTNNETLTVDFETTFNLIDLNTTSGATVIRNQLALWQNANIEFTAPASQLSWLNRSRLSSNADGQVAIEISARTAGVTLDGATADTLIIKDQAGTGQGFLQTSRVVEANTAVAASPNAITEDESFRVFTNEGAAAANHHTLPTASAGLTYTFIVQDADGIVVNANTGDTIRIAGSVSSTGGTATSTTIGDSLTLVAINTTEYVAVSVVGTGWALA